MRITEQAHHIVKSIVQANDTVLDATAGNGNDTVFLSQLVGPAGRVYAFDISRDAIESTRHRLLQLQIENVNLIEADHALMEQFVSHELAAVMFNLGYLPGSDHSLITKPTSTLSALAAACRLIRNGGVITICAYVGHLGGREEAENVLSFCRELNPNQFAVTIPEEWESIKPRLIVIRKKN